MAPFLPYGRQTIEDDDIHAVATALRSDFLTTGPAVEAFETAFAKAVDAPYAVACNGGTAALHMAMMSIGTGPGDVCIVPSITFVATANAAIKGVIAKAPAQIVGIFIAGNGVIELAAHHGFYADK